MRLEHAIYQEVSVAELRTMLQSLGIPVAEGASIQEIIADLARSRVSAVFLVEYLNVGQMKSVARALGITSEGSKNELRQRLIEHSSGHKLNLPSPTTTATDDFPVGALIEWKQAETMGSILERNGAQVRVQLDDGSTQVFSVSSGALERVRFGAGAPVMRGGLFGVVTGSLAGQPAPTWAVTFADGTSANVPESSLRPAQMQDPIARIKSGQFEEARDFNLRTVTADYWTAHQHNALVSLGHARVDLKPHQVSVVHRIVSKYPHRFLLADEVGLGKTIEAAMILKELRARKQAERVLILVPPGLTRQWQFELKTKFNETFAIYDSNVIKYLKQKGVTNPWTDTPSVIVSHSWASWTPERRRQIAEVAWDVIIVDEAHHARRHKDGRQTQLYKLVHDLVARPEFSRRAVLFLTATPMQLHRSELYSMLDMLDPVLFASQEDFSKHVQSLAGLNRIVESIEKDGIPGSGIEREALTAEVGHYLDLDREEVEKLLSEESAQEIAIRLRSEHRLSEIMVRNRKSIVGGFQPRRATRWEVSLSTEESEIQRLMRTVLDRGFRLAEETNQNALGFLMVILQKLLASSSRALAVSLKKRRDAAKHALTESEFESELVDDQEVSQLASRVAPDQEIPTIDLLISHLEQIKIDSKTQVLLDQLAKLFDTDQDAKVLIFTEFRETQDMLFEAIDDKGWGAWRFHGQLTADGKEAAVQGFRTSHGPQVLISTEAGGEGRNFQFCHYLVNYDLPWNPMKVEQRIGRLDRIGQKHPVSIFNFHVEETIEGRILDVLERRIRVFEDTVGGLDPILGEAEADIRKAIRLAEEDQERELERLGKRLEARVVEARRAEKKLRDLIMESKSYSAEIAQTALGEQSPISPEAFEEFMFQLLKSARTWIDSPRPNGERRIVFHAPFTLEHPEVIQGQEVRRVCFDPRVEVDSDEVEYFGFGHPIVDALVKRVLEEKKLGLTAVRRLPGSTAAVSGWQFNWLISIAGLSKKEFVYPVFIDDEMHSHSGIAQELVESSRRFQPETSSVLPDLEHFDQAVELAQKLAGSKQDEELDRARADAEARADLLEERTRALYDYRMRATEDRINLSNRTLERLRRSEDAQQQKALPLWEANLSRAEAEQAANRDDLERQLLEIRNSRHPTGEFSLLNVARIERGSQNPGDAA